MFLPDYNNDSYPIDLSQEEANEMSASEKEDIYRQAEKKYWEAGADYVIRTMRELPGVIQKINEKGQ